MKKYTLEQLSQLSIKDFNKNFKFLGEGISRRVYSINKYLVVKVAKGEDGIHQNFVENYVFNNCAVKYKKYLCPILYYNNKILIMPKAEPFLNVLRQNFIDLSLIRDEVTVKQDIFNFSCEFMLFLDDLYSPSSWGMIYDNYYLIDYGCTSDIGDTLYEKLFGIYCN
ncbi:hypothetical protein [Clostridium tarantellae]|uniref:Uncharacterized protein n=1 Tax=Clostridium tarantellae TaxID=39493 RepID=A0A6I1MII3_9CLOT|nr:hypothetical protein [Clostridium tarantellae]MPQ42218.1 hypothetical protein [Clostridium tarantellae]